MFKTSFKAALLASAFAGLAATAALADEAVVTPAPMAPAAAEEPASPFTISATAGFTTNYMWRGQTQTQDDPAIFGSFDVSHESGLYAGIWASNVDFGDADDANLEFDFYGGFANSINNFSYDLGGVYYLYPGSTEIAGESIDYYEIYAKTGYDFGFLSVGDGVYYSPNYSNDLGDSLYAYGDVTIPIPFLPFDIAAVGSIGYFTFFDDKTRNGLDDYFDYSGGLTASVLGFDLSAKYIGTLGWADTVNGPPRVSKSELADDAFSFTISRTF